MREVRSTPGGEHPDEPQRIRLGNAQRPDRPATIVVLYRLAWRICAEKKIDKSYLTSVWEDGRARLRGEPLLGVGGRLFRLADAVGLAAFEHAVEHAAQMPAQGADGLVVRLAFGAFLLVVAL